ncbi:MAG TPA: hypothetical protein VMW42_01860, partial [Desulfatiglandales bacterium]|nr:hypothetical protein [Desulfatiglandales bacterium]
VQSNIFSNRFLIHSRIIMTTKTKPVNRKRKTAEQEKVEYRLAVQNYLSGGDGAGLSAADRADLDSRRAKTSAPSTTSTGILADIKKFFKN